MNDFLVFSIQAIASLSSGWLLFHWQWDGLIYACVPLVAAFSFLLFTLNGKRGGVEVLNRA
jgi:hypothetical protein